MNKIKAITLTILTFPIIVSIYFLDRVILLPLFWLPSEPMGKWLESGKSAVMSLMRVVVVLLLWGIFELIKYLAS